MPSFVKRRGFGQTFGTGRELSEQIAVRESNRKSNLVYFRNFNSMRRPEMDGQLQVAATSFVVLFLVVGIALQGAAAVAGLAKGQRPV